MKIQDIMKIENIKEIHKRTLTHHIYHFFLKEYKYELEMTKTCA
jgi:hypothetical protein